MMQRYPIPAGNRLELFLGAAIGAITFSGSVIAFGKLSGKYKFRLFQGTPVSFAGQHMLNLVLGLVTVGLGLMFVATEDWTAFFAMLALSFVMGVLIIIPIGGADMPVVVSMLNSYSGWAAAGIGFSLNNSMLIIAGSLVGSSGAILSYIMCKAMNRSFFSVILGGFGAEPGAVVAGAQEQRPVKSGSADDAAYILANAETVVIVPGYGLAVARAQHAVNELAEKLMHKGITVKPKCPTTKCLRWKTSTASLVRSMWPSSWVPTMWSTQRRSPKARPFTACPFWKPTRPKPSSSTNARWRPVTPA